MAVGSLTYRRYNGFNDLEIEGAEILKELPERGVMFVSNHQTYFADVIALYHIFFAANNKRYGNLKPPTYLLRPKTNIYYVAAKETMNAGLLPKLFKYAGAITIKRAWRDAGKEVNRAVDMGEVENIYKAVKQGWVINFPQGTTKPFAPGRKGVIRIINDTNPIVVPVVIDGFRRAFDKKGLRIKKRGVTLRIRFKPPFHLDDSMNKTDQLNKIMKEIEQSPEFIRVKSLDELRQEMK